MSNEVYISIDVETDGPVPGLGSLLSLGAVATDCTGTELGHYYTEFRPQYPSFDREALAVSGLDRDRLLSAGTHPPVAMRGFKSWASGMVTDHKAIPVTFSTWDWLWVYYYLRHFAADSRPFSHSSLDIKSLYAGKFGTGFMASTKRAISKARPHLTEGLPPHTHNALDDAREQSILFHRIRASA